MPKTVIHVLDEEATSAITKFKQRYPHDTYAALGFSPRTLVLTPWVFPFMLAPLSYPCPRKSSIFMLFSLRVLSKRFASPSPVDVEAILNPLKCSLTSTLLLLLPESIRLELFFHNNDNLCLFSILCADALALRCQNFRINRPNPGNVHYPSWKACRMSHEKADCVERDTWWSSSGVLKRTSNDEFLHSSASDVLHLFFDAKTVGIHSPTISNGNCITSIAGGPCIMAVSMNWDCSISGHLAGSDKAPTSLCGCFCPLSISSFFSSFEKLERSLKFSSWVSGLSISRSELLSTVSKVWSN